MRAWSGWGNTLLKVHLARLEELEYLLVHRGGRGQSFVYELLYEKAEDPSKPRLPGLIDVYDLKKSPSEMEKSGPSRPQAGGVPGGGRGEPEPITTGLPGTFCQIQKKSL